MTDDQDAGGSGALEDPLSRCLSPPRIRHPVTSGRFRRSREDLSVASPSECDGGDRPKTSAFCGKLRSVATVRKTSKSFKLPRCIYGCRS